MSNSETKVKWNECKSEKQISETLTYYGKKSTNRMFKIIQAKIFGIGIFILLIWR